MRWRHSCLIDFVVSFNVNFVLYVLAGQSEEEEREGGGVPGQRPCLAAYVWLRACEAYACLQPPRPC